MASAIPLRTLVLFGILVLVGIWTGAFSRYRLWSAERDAYAAFVQQNATCSAQVDAYVEHNGFRTHPDFGANCAPYTPPQWILNDAASF
jgi:hypothetical protein